MNPPSLPVVVNSSIPDARNHIRRQQRFAATVLAVDGDEEYPVINPRRNRMAQPFAAW
jgi:hypothetical protein